jgi:sugar phosphate permease
MAGIYPGLTYLISTWYTRKEQQLRFALLQSGEVIILATGGIVNFGLNQLDGKGGLKGWQWMFLVQGLITCLLGVITYWWMVDFPEHSHRSFWFLTKEESEIMTGRIQRDRGDVDADKFAWKKVLVHASDPNIWGFCVMFFLLNMVSTSMSYFLPIILQDGLHFSTDKSILLNAPVYYWAVVPALVSSFVGDRYSFRGPVIIFNSLVLIIGFCMLGFSDNVAARYAGTYLATGSYVANWAALNAYQANNIVGLAIRARREAMMLTLHRQWKRVFTAATTTAFNGAGGIAGAYIVRYNEAPRYPTAIWASIGYATSKSFVIYPSTYPDRQFSHLDGPLCRPLLGLVLYSQPAATQRSCSH